MLSYLFWPTFFKSIEKGDLREMLKARPLTPLFKVR
jgi:hypothetical protein